MTLEECRAAIGREVTYKPCGGCDFGRESGVIRSVNRTFAFVDYGSGTPKATSPRDLRLRRQVVTG